ncbi:MFS transporter [Pseudooceanicola sediminis]|uniref:MFS transporter n=1 Tax=Pseudooceanicola sediminis TaxID=2211117 RepID=A0A399J5G2_9RHOB|nr:MFS transporter [Pseudooceanicola sediminis]KAA2316825.1 MFS transporter [Puniceibacterium sp. HSS470]RII40718.1 MFS transporter [Pseudooceanicola sediminis]|tara:strand:+ start:190058 stop:191197 length:1140 start_codon:yes stop_codon:yes gene_type:complete
MNRAVALLTGAIAVVGANSMVLAPITAAVARDLGGDPAEIVQAAAAYGLTTAVSAMFLAPRSDTIGADRALNQAVIILILSLVASVLAPSKWALIGAQAIGGLGAGMAIPAIYVLAPQLGPRGEEKRTMGLVLSGWTLALVAGVAGSGFLAEWAGWRAVYVVLGLLMAGLWIAMRRTDLRVPRIATSATSPLTALRVPGITRALFSALMLMLSFYGTYAFVGAHVADALGRGTDVAGIITLCYGTGFGISALLDRYFDRLRPGLAGALSFAALTVIYALLALLGTNLWLLAGLAVLWGMAQHLALNFVVSRLSSLDPSQRGAILGLNSSVTYLAVFGGALAFRHPYEVSGFAICNTVSAIVAAIALVECVYPQRLAPRS